MTEQNPAYRIFNDDEDAAYRRYEMLTFYESREIALAVYDRCKNDRGVINELVTVYDRWGVGCYDAEWRDEVEAHDDGSVLIADGGTVTLATGDVLAVRTLDPEADEWNDYEDAWQFKDAETAAAEASAWRNTENCRVDLVRTAITDGDGTVSYWYGIAILPRRGDDAAGAAD